MKELPSKFRLARLASYRSNEFQYKVGAVIFSQKTPVSIGWNFSKSHPLLANEDMFFNFHAECHAIFNIPFKTKVKNASIYVYREHNGIKNKPMLAKPCEQCLKQIILFGEIKTVYFTTDFGYDILKL